MKRVLATVLLSSSLLVLGGCDHGDDHTDHADHDQADHQQAHDSHVADLSLQLNDGQKWQVDEHTRHAAHKLLVILEKTPAFSSTNDANALAQAFDEELASLVQGCTMEGAAHDQLHLFLVALFPQVEALKDKSNIDELQATRGEIAAILAAYQEYFE